MDRDHFEQTLRAFRERVPFRPFTVALVNARFHEVDHPDALVVRDGIALYVGPGGVPYIFDHEGVAEALAASRSPRTASGGARHDRVFAVTPLLTDEQPTKR
jgi:hypothetical protein